MTGWSRNDSQPSVFLGVLRSDPLQQGLWVPFQVLAHKGKQPLELSDPQDLSNQVTPLHSWFSESGPSTAVAHSGLRYHAAGIVDTGQLGLNPFYPN